jgi:hypothetical protein
VLAKEEKSTIFPAQIRVIAPKTKKMYFSNLSNVSAHPMVEKQQNETYRRGRL